MNRCPSILLRCLAALSAILVLAGCSMNYSPDCGSYSRRTTPTDIQQTEIAREAWRVLSNPSRRAEWPEATKRYNAAVMAIVQRMRCVWLKSRTDIQSTGEWPYAIIKPEFVGGKWTQLYEDTVPCEMVDTSFYLKERVFVQGVGVPLAGIVKTDVDVVKSKVIKDNGNVHTLTAILDFDHPVDGKPALKVLPRLKEETVRVGRSVQPLAADFTAPIALFWQKTHVDRSAFLGMFNPKKALNYQGLYFAEPYDPDKIPVLFIHGLLSSPDTFANMTNRLLSDPVIRQNYQFWYFGYPSGVSWVIPAKELREALQSVCHEYDPDGTSPNLNRMVVAGHSMGGLITRLNNATKPWAMIPYVVRDCEGIKELSYDRAREFKLWDDQATKRAADLLIFEPSKRTRRIVFMATPHKGSDFANRWFGLLGQRLISIPENLLVELTRIGTLSENMLLLNPERLIQEFTSIGQLSPKSPFIKGVQNVYPSPGIPVHSIIGDKGHGDGTRSSDGVVDYYSSHLSWAKSEKIVPSGHSVQDCIPAAGEMTRILKEHLNEEGIGTRLNNDDTPPTVWQENPMLYYYKIFTF